MAESPGRTLVGSSQGLLAPPALGTCARPDCQIRPHPAGAAFGFIAERAGTPRHQA
ncbi:MAG TPA: hypothetical protein VF462_13535 [Micromonosporaceae bacterium]